MRSFQRHCCPSNQRLIMRVDGGSHGLSNKPSFTIKAKESLSQSTIYDSYSYGRWLPRFDASSCLCYDGSHLQYADSNTNEDVITLFLLSFYQHYLGSKFKKSLEGGNYCIELCDLRFSMAVVLQSHGLVTESEESPYLGWRCVNCDSTYPSMKCDPLKKEQRMNSNVCKKKEQRMRCSVCKRRTTQFCWKCWRCLFNEASLKPAGFCRTARHISKAELKSAS